VAKRAEHALADTERLRQLVIGAGFRDVTIATERKLIQFPSPTEYVRIQLAATPLASLAAQYDAAAWERLVDAIVGDVGAALTPYVTDEGLIFPQVVHSALATA
jgi:hypothetical protein